MTRMLRVVVELTADDGFDDVEVADVLLAALCDVELPGVWSINSTEPIRTPERG